MTNESPLDGIPDPPGSGDGDMPRSAAVMRAAAAHPADVDRLLSELRRPVSDGDSLIDLMHRCSKEAVRLLVGVDWAGVTAQFAGPAFTAAHTEHRVLIVDEGQYGQGDGPCLQAVRTGRRVRMSSEDVADRWPVLDKAVQAVGVRSFYAVPLHAEDHTVGCLNLYGGQPGTLTPDPDLVTVLTEFLDCGLSDYAAAQPGGTAAALLQGVLRSGFELNQAVGVLMAVHGVNAGTARDLLDQRADEQDTSLIDAAHSVIRQHTPTGDPIAE